MLHVSAAPELVRQLIAGAIVRTLIAGMNVAKIAENSAVKDVRQIALIPVEQNVSHNALELVPVRPVPPFVEAVSVPPHA